jgi:hypothetical protein
MFPKSLAFFVNHIMFTYINQLKFILNILEIDQLIKNDNKGHLLIIHGYINTNFRFGHIMIKTKTILNLLTLLT